MQTVAAIDAAIFLGIATFQIMLATGKPWGEYAWGGRHPGTLPTNLRRSSAISAVALAAAGLVILIEGELLLPDLESVATQIIAWALAAFLLVGAVMNGVSRSKKERNLWTPVNTVACVLTALVAALS